MDPNFGNLSGTAAPTVVQAAPERPPVLLPHLQAMWEGFLRLSAEGLTLAEMQNVYRYIGLPPAQFRVVESIWWGLHSMRLRHQQKKWDDKLAEAEHRRGAYR